MLIEDEDDIYFDYEQHTISVFWFEHEFFSTLSTSLATHIKTNVTTNKSTHSTISFNPDDLLSSQYCFQ